MRCQKADRLVPKFGTELIFPVVYMEPLLFKLENKYFFYQ